MRIKIYIRLFILLAAQQYILSCSPKDDKTMQNQLKEELNKINQLLRDKNFAQEMAQTLEAAYYNGVGEKPPVFLKPGDDTAKIKKPAIDEKTATSIAPFYALECGIGVLCETHGGTPVEWLKKINDNTLDTSYWLLLNRFANATWKAGQPFRDLNRIERPVFIIANFLSAEEVKKDKDQLKAASIKLSDAMKDVADSSKTKQFDKLKQLMQSETFAFETARHADSSYSVSQKQPVPSFAEYGKDTSTITKTVKQEKIATNIAGFYALECGINYMVTIEKRLPSQILDSIKNNTINDADKTLLLRFANATWKAGQPFRGLERIRKDNFIPASMLSKEELEKDWVQIRAAAEKLLEKLSQ